MLRESPRCPGTNLIISIWVGVGTTAIVEVFFSPLESFPYALAKIFQGFLFSFLLAFLIIVSLFVLEVENICLQLILSYPLFSNSRILVLIEYAHMLLVICEPVFLKIHVITIQAFANTR